MAQNYKYAAEDFERYHSGKMSDVEMHAIEKAALQDPFLADALEGYAYSASPVTDIAELKERISTKHKRKKTFPWLRVAAMVILIAGIGYLAYQLNFNEKGSQLATKQVDEKNINKQIEALTTDTSLPDQDLVINTPAKQNDGLIKKESKSNASESRGNDDKPVDKPSAYQLDQNKQAPAVPDVQKEKAENSNAKIADNESENDRSANQKLGEVAVASNKVERAARSRALENVLEGKAPGVVMVNDSASQPVTANEFSVYVKNNINIPRDESGKNYKGKVVLSFIINKRGRAKDIEVEQSLCKPCDEEAIRLLNQGPKWKFINDKRQVVIIEF